MEIFEVAYAPPRSSDEFVLCIGKFDGVHIGHQAVIRTARQYAGSGQLGVISLWPHPRWTLQRDPDYQRALTPVREKRRLLEQYGVDRLYEIDFTEEYAKTSPEIFVLEHLAGLNLKRVVVGDGFNFGKGVHSTTDELVELCSRIGVPVTVVPPVTVNERVVSSSDIRCHVKAGRVEAAQALLGRPYTLTGEVVHGAGLGRKLGFPTANLGGIDDFVLPAPGVYEGIAEIHSVKATDNTYWYTLISAGYRPTVNGTSYEVEAYLIDFDGDLYGKDLSVSFLRRARDEIQFTTTEALIEQMRVDEQLARDRFGLHKS
ncbi:riboflavin biosynthesis protein RibF [Alicyclobacillus acidiphilus]|uniref:riboflavin biosynthesis protein RibF n=1 Tax=Alicyclobacillus acidiphilus TaxID=182455 RepID=UPI0008328B90